MTSRTETILRRFRLLACGLIVLLSIAFTPEVFQRTWPELVDNCEALDGIAEKQLARHDVEKAESERILARIKSEDYRSDLIKRKSGTFGFDPDEQIETLVELRERRIRASMLKARIAQHKAETCYKDRALYASRKIQSLGWIAATIIVPALIFFLLTIITINLGRWLLAVDQKR